MKFFCIKCGEAINYSMHKPESCPSCKYIFGQMLETKKNTVSKKYEIEIDTSDEDAVDFSNLKIEVDEKPRKVMIEDLAYDRNQVSTVRGQGPGGGKQVLDQIATELKSIK